MKYEIKWDSFPLKNKNSAWNVYYVNEKATIC